MDFGALLHMAKKNSENVKNSEGKYYSTKFSAPKKESKEKKLSENIKKFLAKKEQEEREAARAKNEEVTRLLAMRDEKSKNKIRKMLKVTKSANKSVLADAIDNDNTAVTLQGPDQPDEDDYGYVSQEAASLYQKYMDKVKALPEENKFAPSKSTIKTDLSGTKDRVKEAIRKEQEDKMNCHRSKSLKTTSIDNSSKQSSLDSFSGFRKKKDLYDPELEREKEKEEQKRREEERKKAKFKKPAPPPLDFQELLKLAEKKQHEPVEIEIEVDKEPERLLTKKQKKELEERKAYLDERGRKERSGNDKKNGPPIKVDNKQALNGKIPKLNAFTPSNDARKFSSNIITSKQSISILPTAGIESKKLIHNNNNINNNNYNNSFKKTKIQSSSDLKPASHKEVVKTKNYFSQISKDFNNKNLPQSNTKESSKSSLKSNINAKPISASKTIYPQKTSKPSTLTSQKISTNIKKQELQYNSNETSRPVPSSSTYDRERTRQFPPPDVRRNNLIKKPLKRRIIDDEDEYDPELDDFIDDGVEEDNGNYSSYIKEIFGYDKSRYRDIDDDDLNMESSFVQQMKEEQISKKIGLQEDLEDMRKEAEEKKRKAIMKKKKIK